MDKREDFTMIPVSKEVRRLIKSRGAKGETYDSIIRRLLRK